MEIISSESFLVDFPTAVCLGKFDGIHIGHQKIVNECLKEKALGLKTLVFTFNPTPYSFFNPGAKELMTLEEKRQRFEKMGVDILVEFPFNEHTCKITAQDFLEKVLVGMCNAEKIVSGPDLSFGYKGLGNAELITKNSFRLNISHSIVDKEMLDGEEVSSTYLRELILRGDVSKAALALGEKVTIKGVVCEGRKLGRTLDFPTANIYPAQSKLLPAFGVYSSKVFVDGTERAGITNIGMRPTVNKDSERVSVETFIKDFDKDIYGKIITVELLEFIRPERKFDSVENLKKQVQLDIEKVFV